MIDKYSLGLAKYKIFKRLFSVKTHFFISKEIKKNVFLFQNTLLKNKSRKAAVSEFPAAFAMGKSRTNN